MMSTMTRRWACLVVAALACPARAADLLAHPPPPVPSAAGVARGEATCPHAVRVYTYDFAAGLPFNELAARARARPAKTHFDGEHLLAQFTLEFVLADFFRQACIRTDDPARADFFFVPFYSDIEYRDAGRPDAPSVYGQALLDIFEKNSTAGWVRHFGVTDKWWRLAPERHLIVQAAPVTGFRHPKSRRGFSHLMVQLAPPIFLSVEVTRTWAAEYPRCAAKNVVMPYPVPGRDWHNGEWARKGAAMRAGADDGADVAEATFARAAAGGGGARDRGARDAEGRSLLAMYHGGRHGCVVVRDAIAAEVKADPECSGATYAKLLVRYQKLVDARFRGTLPRQAVMHAARFCPCPEGDSPSAKRMYDALLAGCVPVVVSDDAVYALSREIGGPVDAAAFALRVGEPAVVAGPDADAGGGLLARLRAVNASALAQLRDAGRRAAHLYRYYAEGAYARDPLVEQRYPDGGAPAALAWELERRRALGASAHWRACATELSQPHWFAGKQYCGKVPLESELARVRKAVKGASSPAKRAVLEKELAALEAGHVYRRGR